MARRVMVVSPNRRAGGWDSHPQSGSSGPHTHHDTADADVHSVALERLFALAAGIAKEVHVVLLPKTQPWATLHVRGESMPSMVVPIAADRVGELHAVERSIRQIGARLFMDLGGFYVQYGTFAEDE